MTCLILIAILMTAAGYADSRTAAAVANGRKGDGGGAVNLSDLTVLQRRVIRMRYGKMETAMWKGDADVAYREARGLAHYARMTVTDGKAMEEAQ